jgi:hypothetical protein
MTCGVFSKSGGHLGRHFEPIMGTWDYKWPLGTVISVAFQRPPGVEREEFEAAKRRIKRLARLWNDSEASVKLAFVNVDFPPPNTKKLDGALVSHPQQRSLVKAGADRPYDVLVSLERLPVKIVDTIATKREEPRDLPFSELGTFARRVNYGQPTIYIGPTPEAAAISLADYYKGRLAQHMVVHEFGHVLGLAHEHQSPVARRDIRGLMKSLDAIEGHTAAKRTGMRKVHFDKDFIKGNVRNVWPGNERFSDWRSYEDEPHLSSVMAGAYVEHVHRHGAANSNGQRPPSEIIVAPTTSDLAFLAKIYPHVKKKAER